MRIEATIKVYYEIDREDYNGDRLDRFIADAVDEGAACVEEVLTVKLMPCEGCGLKFESPSDECNCVPDAEEWRQDDYAQRYRESIAERGWAS